MNHDSCERLLEDTLLVLVAAKDCCMTCVAGSALKTGWRELCYQMRWASFMNLLLWHLLLPGHEPVWILHEQWGSNGGCSFFQHSSLVFLETDHSKQGWLRIPLSRRPANALQLTGKHLAHCEPVQKPDLIRIKIISAQFKHQTNICFGVKNLWRRHL